MKDQRIIFIFLFCLFCQCKNSGSNVPLVNSIVITDNCDENFIYAIRAIESDSFEIADLGYLRTEFFSTFKMPDSSILIKKCGFLAEFHKAIDTSQYFWKNEGLNVIFDEEIISNYSNNDLEIRAICYPMFRIISKDTADFWLDNPNKVRYEEKFYSFSKPILSIDDKYMLLEMNMCCGRNCGGGSTYFFEKIKGKWKVKDFWIRYVA